MQFEHEPHRDPSLRQFTVSDDYSRAYIFCKLSLEKTAVYTVVCLIQAIRQWKVTPKAILFDNGSEFRGSILETFCKNVGIEIIHSSVHHPQTNGKLERAFRDDRRDFYFPRKECPLEVLQKELPDYIYYRNHQRGHWALKGKPAITRLCEQDRFASDSLLAELEKHAEFETERRRVNFCGYIQLFGKPLYVDKNLKEGSSVQCVETVNGLDVRQDGLSFGILKDYYLYKVVPECYRHDKLPGDLVLQQPSRINCP